MSVPIGQMRESATLVVWDFYNDKPLAPEDRKVAIRHDVAYLDPAGTQHNHYILHLYDDTEFADPGKIPEDVYQQARSESRRSFDETIPYDVPFDVSLLPLIPVALSRYV
jgi:hypothetical protein